MDAQLVAAHVATVFQRNLYSCCQKLLGVGGFLPGKLYKIQRKIL